METPSSRIAALNLVALPTPESDRQLGHRLMRSAPRAPSSTAPSCPASPAAMLYTISRRRCLAPILGAAAAAEAETAVSRTRTKTRAAVLWGVAVMPNLDMTEVAVAVFTPSSFFQFGHCLARRLPSSMRDT